MTAVLNICTGEAVDSALAHALDMLNLCRGDNLAARNQIPALYLRLGRVQEAYDFIKWYIVGDGSKTSYNFLNPNLPFLNLKGEDALELLDGWKFDFGLSIAVAMTLIKVRLLLDVTMLSEEVKNKKGAKMAIEQKMTFLKEHGTTDVLLAWPDIVNQENYQPTVEKLLGQVNTMYRAIKKQNKCFWPAIVNPDMIAARYPTVYTPGSEEEAVLAFRESRYAWAEDEATIIAIRKVFRDDR